MNTVGLSPVGYHHELTRVLNDVFEIPVKLHSEAPPPSPSPLMQMVSEIIELKDRNGRLFVIGFGGGAANASHAVNDFRKLCGIRAYTPVDNVAELTARMNDEGMHRAFVDWLAEEFASGSDALLVFSVGGGTDKVSTAITEAVEYSVRRGITVLGVVGPEGGATANLGTAVVKVHAEGLYVTPITEAVQAVVWHYLVSHPKIQERPTTW